MPDNHETPLPASGHAPECVHSKREHRPWPHPPIYKTQACVEGCDLPTFTSLYHKGEVGI